MITCGVFVGEKEDCLPAICKKYGKITIMVKSEIYNWLKPFHVITPVTSHDVWSVSLTKMLNVLPTCFEKYPKLLSFYTFCHIIHMKWLTSCHLATFNHLWQHVESLWEKKVECLPAIGKKCFKISFSGKKWNLQLIESLSYDHSNY